MILFLTDGRATEGETDNEVILSNVRGNNSVVDAAIFCLAFGRQADFGLLKMLSLQNNAFARKVGGGFFVGTRTHANIGKFSYWIFPA